MAIQWDHRDFSGPLFLYLLLPAVNFALMIRLSLVCGEPLDSVVIWLLLLIFFIAMLHFCSCKHEVDH